MGGFTLIELMVVLAVAAGLAALAAPAFDRMLEGTQYRSVLRVIASELRTARALARSEGRAITFEVDLAQKRFGIHGRRQHNIPSRVSVLADVAEVESTGTTAGITFLPQGGATGGTIEVRRPDGAGTRMRVDWLSAQVSQERIEP